MKVSRPLMVLVHLACIALLVLVMLPGSVKEVADLTGFDVHHIGFYTGTSLYFYADGLVPGRDYTNIYTVGYNYLFSLFFHDGNPQTALEGHVRMVLIFSSLFFMQFYLLAYKVLRSPLYALLLSLFLLLMTFFIHRQMYHPGLWPLRFVLLPAVCWLFVRGVMHARLLNLWQVALGSAIGISFFLYAETAIYMLACALFGQVLVHGKRGWKPAVAVLAVSLIVFWGIVFGIYGPDVFSREFVVNGLLSGCLMFAGGYNSMGAVWKISQYMLVYLVLPGMLVVMTGACAARFLHERKTLTAPEREELITIIFCGLLGACMLNKWINATHDGALFQNWHLMLLVDLALVVKLIREAPKFWQRGMLHAVLLAFFIYFAGFHKDQIFRFGFGVDSYRFYPSLINSWVKLFPPRDQDKIPLPQISARDIALIQENTEPGERVALYAPNDTAYLITAQRAPRSHWMPAVYDGIYTHWQYLWSADKIFVDPAMKDIPQDFLRDYAVTKRGDKLVMYQRKENNP